MAEIIIRKNRRGPPRFRYIVKDGRGRPLIQSKLFHRRAIALGHAQRFVTAVQQGVSINE
jgi:hypothetical protein